MEINLTFSNYAELIDFCKSVLTNSSTTNTSTLSVSDTSILSVSNYKSNNYPKYNFKNKNSSKDILEEISGDTSILSVSDTSILSVSDTESLEYKDRTEELKEFCAGLKATEDIKVLTKFYKFYTSPDKENPTKTIAETRKFWNLEKMWQKWKESER